MYSSEWQPRARPGKTTVKFGGGRFGGERSSMMRSCILNPMLSSAEAMAGVTGSTLFSAWRMGIDPGSMTLCRPEGARTTPAPLPCAGDGFSLSPTKMGLFPPLLLKGDGGGGDGGEVAPARPSKPKKPKRKSMADMAPLCGTRHAERLRDFLAINCGVAVGKGTALGFNRASGIRCWCVPRS
eukprot:scaffold17716_cov134-Isochrysis_galbana.AAC.2